MPKPAKSNGFLWITQSRSISAVFRQSQPLLCRNLLLGVPTSKTEIAAAKMPARLKRKPQLVYAAPGNARIQALRMAWPIVARRLEGMPNISAMQLFDELCIQFPGRFTRRQYPALLRRVNRWREDARNRGVSVVTKTYRVFNDKRSGRKRDIFADHWKEMLECVGVKGAAT